MKIKYHMPSETRESIAAMMSAEYSKAVRIRAVTASACVLLMVIGIGIAVSRNDDAVISADNVPESTDVIVGHTAPAETPAVTIYGDTAFMDIPSTGAVMTYEQLMDDIDKNSVQAFVKYEIVSKYAPEEAVRITGERAFENSASLYSAHVTYDYLNDEPNDFYINIAKSGTPELQREGDPLYLDGQVLISALFGVGETYQTAVPELLFYVFDDEQTAYHIDKRDMIVSDSICTPVDHEEREVVTSTPNNPVRFSDRSDISSLGEFIRKDWSERGLDFAGPENYGAAPICSEDVPVIDDSEELPVIDSGEDTAVIAYVDTAKVGENYSVRVVEFPPNANYGVIREVSDRKQKYGNDAVRVLESCFDGENSFAYPVDIKYNDSYFYFGPFNIKTEKGESIYAMLDGKVVYAGFDSPFGNALIIEHGKNNVWLYAFCDDLCVSEGDTVKAGDVIAHVGCTGYAEDDVLYLYNY